MTEPSLATLWRGPLLVGTILLALLFPYLTQLSFRTLGCIACLGIGALLTLYDVTHYLHDATRHQFVVWLDTVVLDDVLRFIFDPQTGLIATVVSCFVGNASMYALPMTTEQRVRLVNSCLWTTPAQARTILTTPGGMKQLFPERIQQWLQYDEEKTTKIADSLDMDKVRTVDCDKFVDSDDDSSDQASEDTEELPATPARERDFVSQNKRNLLPVGVHFPADRVAASGPSACCSLPYDTVRRDAQHVVEEEDPMKVMGNIIKDQMTRSLKNLVPTNFSESVVPAVGVSVTAVFLLSRLQTGTRRSVVSMAAGAAMATLWSKGAPLSIADLIMYKTVPSSVIEQVAAVVRKCRCPHGRKWKAAIAFFVLWYVSRRQRARISLSPNR